MTDWVEIQPRRKDAAVTRLAQLLEPSGAYIAGSWPAYAASPRRRPDFPSDIDVWLHTEDRLEVLQASLEFRDFELVTESEIGAVYRAPKTGEWSSLPCPVQVIKPRREGNLVTFGPPPDVVGAFDFTVCRAWLGIRGQVFADPDFERDELARRLVLRNITCPVAAILRVAKYARKGYRVPVRTALQILQSWEGRERDEQTSKAIEEVLSESEDWTQEQWQEWYGTVAGRLLRRVD